MLRKPDPPDPAEPFDVRVERRLSVIETGMTWVVRGMVGIYGLIGAAFLTLIGPRLSPPGPPSPGLVELLSRLL